MRRVSTMTVLLVAGLSALLSLVSWIIPFSLGTESNSVPEKAVLFGFGETGPLDARLTQIRSWPIVQQDTWHAGSFDFVRAFGSMSGRAGWAIESTGEIGWPLRWMTARSYYVGDSSTIRDTSSAKFQFLAGLQSPLKVHWLPALANVGFWLTLNCMATGFLLRVRSSIRLRRGLCPNCKYIVSRLKQCPECGMLIGRGQFGMPIASREIVNAQHH